MTKPTKADARAFLSTVEVDVLRGDWVDPAGARVLFSEWATRWWSTTVNLRPSTRARDASYFANHIEPEFADLPLGAIDHLMVREWIASLTGSGLAPATVQKAHQIMAKIMRAAVDGGMIGSSPCDRQPLPKVEREEMRFLAADDVAHLAATIDPRYRSLVLISAYGGLRAGELFALRRKRVDVLRAQIQVAETVSEVQGHHHFGPPKTRSGRRTVPLPRSVADELGAHLEGVKGATALVFPAPNGGPVRASLWRRRFWAPGCVAAGLGEMVKGADDQPHYRGLRLHDLRHTAVALWIAAGASGKEIAARAGHSSVVTVLDRYGHLLPGTEERVTEKLDAMARSAKPRSAKVVPLR